MRRHAPHRPGVGAGSPLRRGDVDLAERVLLALAARGATLGVAESLTGGALTAWLVGVPGASTVLRGAVVPYATDLKERLLGVDGALLAARGPVDADVARQMAARARLLLGADLGVATTGVAGPGPQDAHPPGTVHVAVAWEGGSWVRSVLLAGLRSQVREAASGLALSLVLAAAEQGSLPARCDG